MNYGLVEVTIKFVVILMLIILQMRLENIMIILIVRIVLIVNTVVIALDVKNVKICEDM